MASDRAEEVLGAASSSVAFLLSQQSRDGCWRDWSLPPGPSDQWATAYIGFRLAAAPEPIASATAAARASAAAWLVGHEFPGGGWGYNDAVGPDADSTAWALLFLAREPAPLPRSSYEFLAGFQQADGGFSTYPGDAGLGSWCTPQVDVTAVAARALLGRAGGEDGEWSRTSHPIGRVAVERALRYLVGHRGQDGIWESFWWASPLYATAAVLSLMRDARTPSARTPDAGTCDAGTRHARTTVDAQMVGDSLGKVSPANSFEQALLLECFVQAGMASAARVPAAMEALEALFDAQLTDGSWPCAPVLRLADRGVTTRAEPVAGPLFADQNRLFTTATVLGALSELLGVGLEVVG